MQTQRPMGTGQLEFWDVSPNISYAQSFVHAKITNSTTMRFAAIVIIGKGKQRYNLKGKEIKKEISYIRSKSLITSKLQCPQNKRETN